MKHSLATSFEATAGKSHLPVNARVLRDAALFQIIDWLVSTEPPLVQRMIILFDADRPELLVHGFLSAVHHMSTQIRCGIIAVAESKGRVAVYYSDPLTVDKAQRTLSEAAHEAIWPIDRWALDLSIVPMRGGVLARDRLPENHPLLAAPARFQYGLVEVRL